MGVDIVSWLDWVISEREDAAAKAQESEASVIMRRCVADRMIIDLHGYRAHSCPTYDCDGDLSEHARFYDHEVCPVVQQLANGYGWTAGQTPPIEGDRVT
ncbi:hypothetical protein ACIQUW_33130 [Streptomyces sp. NPDC101117]|uniref:hypothetical protein n=1 Tax=Streptomyces sp. NPDC101117 TaxID=3366108 RepID=UPI003815B2C1